MASQTEVTLIEKIVVGGPELG